MKLSKNLSLSELTKSNTAQRLGIDNSPTSEHITNLVKVANNVFQPIRDHFAAPIFISSGYRSEALNDAIGGSKTSQHSKGEAIDIDNDAVQYPTNRMIFDYINDHLEFDQLIWEFGDDSKPDWVHVSFTDQRKNRKQLLRAIKEHGKTIYVLYEK
jgi:zinc D-Ala-D-Ala carboxypeptidase